MSAADAVAGAELLHHLVPRPHELAGQPRRARRRDQPPAEVAQAGRPPRGGGDGEGGHDHLGDVGHRGGGAARRCRGARARRRRRPGRRRRRRRRPGRSAGRRGAACGAGRPCPTNVAGRGRHGNRPRPDGHRRHPIQAAPRALPGRAPPARRARRRTGAAIARISRCMCAAPPIPRRGRSPAAPSTMAAAAWPAAMGCSAHDASRGHADRHRTQVRWRSARAGLELSIRSGRTSRRRRRRRRCCRRS